MALAAASHQQLAARTGGLTAARRGWLGLAQTAAKARLSEIGLPSRRDEYWRYTAPDALISTEPDLARVFDPQDETPAFSSLDALKLVFVDGVFDPVASDDLHLSGLGIERLAEAGSNDIHWARDLYAELEARGQTPVRRPFAVLNSAYATDGVLIRVTEKVSRPISLIYHHKSESSDVILHHCIKMESGAELTVLESGPAAARLNMVMEVDLGKDAAFHHVRLQGRDHDRKAVTHLFARIGANARFKSFTLTANGALTRNECVLDLVGEGASAHVAGAAVGDGQFHQDDTVFVTHAAAHCESRQVFKKVLKNGAVGVFQGKILVKPGAQKTDGYQLSQSLLLDGDSQFLAKPELEIYADDVKCSHGSTSGAIDDTALFYLRSRGVPVKQAQSLLVLAFLAEAIDEIEDNAIADDITARLEGWLHRHES